MLDGPRLWPLLQPYLPGDIEARVRASARHEALRRIAIAALGSATLGLLVGLGLQGLRVEEAAPVAAAPVVATPSTTPSTTPATVPAPNEAAPVAAAEAAVAPAVDARSNPNPDAATLDRYQADLARALAGKPGIASGVWLTRQTLAINRTGELERSGRRSVRKCCTTLPCATCASSSMPAPAWMSRCAGGSAPRIDGDQQPSMAWIY